jgi:hypothetical protein
MPSTMTTSGIGHHQCSPNAASPWSLSRPAHRWKHGHHDPRVTGFTRPTLTAPTATRHTTRATRRPPKRATTHHARTHDRKPRKNFVRKPRCGHLARASICLPAPLAPHAAGRRDRRRHRVSSSVLELPVALLGVSSRAHTVSSSSTQPPHAAPTRLSTAAGVAVTASFERKSRPRSRAVARLSHAPRFAGTSWRSTVTKTVTHGACAARIRLTVKPSSAPATPALARGAR